ncbi:BTB/POZ domain-containing protein-like protein [Tanacetum coccineum]
MVSSTGCLFSAALAASSAVAVASIPVAYRSLVGTTFRGRFLVVAASWVVQVGIECYDCVCDIVKSKYEGAEVVVVQKGERAKVLGKRMFNKKRYLVLEKNRKLVIKLYPELPQLARDFPPIASFNVRVVSLLGGRETLLHPEVKDKQFKSGEPFVLALEVPLTGRFIVDVEFLDLKITSSNGGESCSIWSEGLTQKSTISTALTSLGKMLSESVHTYITICASNGTIEADRAVLAARSPIFHSMFSHDLKEKEMSAINIFDMIIEACQAFLSYIYTNIEHQDFIKHRLDLLRVADKYDVLDLKDACEESLMEDIATKNVLERLQSASMYRLPKLKVCCIQYLVKFGKIYVIREEFNPFIQSGDRDLIGDVVNEILSVWKEHIDVVVELTMEEDGGGYDFEQIMFSVERGRFRCNALWTITFMGPRDLGKREVPIEWQRYRASLPKLHGDENGDGDGDGDGYGYRETAIF